MWSERVMVGVWMLMTLVLTRSYAGNLMSQLAVRNIDHSYQSLKDVLDDSNVGIILVENTLVVQYVEVSDAVIVGNVLIFISDNRIEMKYNNKYGLH